MQFYSPENFIYLWSIPVTVIIFWWASKIRRKKISRIGSPSLIEQKLFPNFRPQTQISRLITLLLAITFCVLSLARPQWGDEKKKIERKGIDIIFMLDTSLSMLAEDIKPNRLEKSKMEIRSFLRQLKGDRVGMVAFAGSSFLQSPLTLDYSAFQLFVDAVQPGYIPDPGTSLAQAMMLALKSFPNENLKHKAIVLLTDGEDHEGGIEDILEQAKKTGIRIYTLGMGSEKGDPIPLKNEQGQRAGFKKDRNGQVVLTRLAPEVLQKIAQSTGALYAPATPGEQEVSVYIKHMDSIDKRQFSEKMVTEKEDHFQLFLLLALILLSSEMFVKQTQKRKSSGTQIAALIFLFIFHSGFLDTSRSLNNKASKQFNEKKYQSAAENLLQAEVKNPKDPVIRYNLGSTLYQTKDFAQASKQLEQAVKTASEKPLLQSAWYNYGNAQYRLGNFEKAEEAYRKALELNPKDKDAKYNLEFLQNKKSQMDKKDQQQKKQDQKNQNNQQQNQQDQQNQQNQSQQQKQDQQNQQQNQNQQNQDQNQQGQGQQNQDQQNQSGEDQKDQNQSQGKEDQENQGSQQDKQDQDQKSGQDQKDIGGSDQENQNKPQNEDKQDQGEESDQNQEQDQDQENKAGGDQETPDQGTDQDKQNQAAGSSGQKLQGQMSINDALQILEALKDSEKGLQDLRKPPTKHQQRPVDKDW